MFTYFIILSLSLGGISVIAIKHKEDILGFRFALFMENLVLHFKEWWYSEVHAYFLKVLEKFLRKLRIWVLKIEGFLFRKARVVRGISERNGNGNGAGKKDENALE